MKLTKLQRHTLYCILEHEIETCSQNCICGAMENNFDIVPDEDCRFSVFKIMMPELWKNRHEGTDQDSGYLFYSSEERLVALRKCIKETYC